MSLLTLNICYNRCHILFSATPTLHPPGYTGGEPTAHPPGYTGGEPTAHPPGYTGGEPTAHPPGYTGGEPTAFPPGYTGETPTAQPHGHTGGEPTPFPPGYTGPTPAITSCTKSHWSAWINRDNPSIGNGDYESFTNTEKAAFCIGGIVNRIECITSDGIASYSSGEQIMCSLQNGLVCNNSDNAPLPCSDYKIRYFCQCEGWLFYIFYSFY